jgi:hypothetical protein
MPTPPQINELRSKRRVVCAMRLLDHFLSNRVVRVRTGLVTLRYFRGLIEFYL